MSVVAIDDTSLLECTEWIAFGPIDAQLVLNGALGPRGGVTYVGMHVCGCENC
jgi:hypothetical protein